MYPADNVFRLNYGMRSECEQALRLCMEPQDFGFSGSENSRRCLRRAWLNAFISARNIVQRSAFACRIRGGREAPARRIDVGGGVSDAGPDF
jgi:hypothetical protein